ncbi:MAG: hypothetical protein ACE37H_09155 [Phycisphaeraceae bacterium]
MHGFRPVFLLVMVCALVCLSTPIRAQDGPDTGGLDTEPGLRLQIYWIGDNFNKKNARLVVQPGASANVDFTVPGVAVKQDAVFEDNQAIIDRSGEEITGRYIAEWSGWINIHHTGKYTFDLNTKAAVTFTIGGQTVTSKKPVTLEKGWQPLSLVQVVKTDADKPIRLTRLLEDGAGKAVAIQTKELLAPKFYFRPTQIGTKELLAEGARPGLGKKLVSVHPGYRLTNIRPNEMEMPVGGLGMLSDGRLVVARFEARSLKAPSPTEEPNGELWLIRNPDSDDPETIKGEKIADHLYEPSGVHVIDDVIYVSQRSELSKFTFNESTKQWDKAVVASGWETNDFHQISAGLPWVPGPTADHPGFFYMSRGAGLGKNQNPPNHGSVWKIDLSKPAGENVEVLTGGHRTPNGLGLNKAGECFVIDNQGGWTPANEINHVQKGKFYGYHQRHNPPKAYGSPFQPEVRDGKTGVTDAAILLPQDEIGNSPTELLLFPDGHGFDGQLALGDMRYGGLNRVYLEEVKGVWQGCVMRFTQGLEGGPNRIFFGPDGALYVGGIGGHHAGTWAWHDPQRGNRRTFQGLERLTPTGESAFEIHHMTATRDGFVLAFTQPVAKDVLEDPATYTVEQWTYVATGKYGGPKIDPHELKVTNAVASADRKSVTLTIPDRKEGYVIKLTTDPVSDQGKAIWSGDVWYTLNKIPD